MPDPRVAIVILNWNGEKFLEKFLPSVFKTSYSNYEVVIADNNSSDGSVQFLQQHYPDARIVQTGGNFGYAGGYNKALKEITADYYMLLNSDVETEPEWIDHMVRLLETDSKIAACQPKIKAYNNKNFFEYAGASGGWLDQYGYPFSKGRVFEICEEDKGQYDQQAPIFWASGAALFIRSSIFHELKGFDEYFFAHQEEIDLCWRIQAIGYKIYSCPSAVVYHVGGGTLPRGNSKKTYLNFRNNHIMMAKNYPLSKSIWIIPFRFSLDGVSAWKSLLSGESGYFFAIIRSHFGFLNWLLFKKKKPGPKPVDTSALEGYTKKNIAWLHFVRKLGTFSEIMEYKD